MNFLQFSYILPNKDRADGFVEVVHLDLWALFLIYSDII